MHEPAGIGLYVDDVLLSGMYMYVGMLPWGIGTFFSCGTRARTGFFRVGPFHLSIDENVPGTYI